MAFRIPFCPSLLLSIAHMNCSVRPSNGLAGRQEVQKAQSRLLFGSVGPRYIFNSEQQPQKPLNHINNSRLISPTRNYVLSFQTEWANGQKVVLVSLRGHIQKVNERTIIFLKINEISTYPQCLIKEMSTFFQHQKNVIHLSMAYQ